MKKRVSWLVSFLLLPLLAVAQGLAPPKPRQIAGQLEHVFQFFYGLMQNEYSQYGITVIFAFILFYVVFAAPAKKLRIFEGEGGLGLNRLGHLFAIACAGLATTAVFAFQENVSQAARRFFLPFGFYGALFASMLIFLLVFRGMRDTPSFGPGRTLWALFAAFCAWVFLGFLIADKGLVTFGLLILFLLAAVGVARGAWHWRARRGGLAPSTVRRAEETEEDVAQRMQRMRHREQHVENLERQLQQEVARAAQNQGTTTAQNTDLLRRLVEALEREQRGGE